MGRFEDYMTEQFVGKDYAKVNVGKEIYKALAENWTEKLGYIPLRPMALIQVTDPKDPTILTGIGFSEPDDLLLDNFGVFLSSTINNGPDLTRTCVDENGIVRSIKFQEASFSQKMYCNNTVSGGTVSLGGFLKIGQDSTAPTRPDFDLTQPFISGPQSGNIAPLKPVWDSDDQQGDVTGLVTNATLGGTVRECGLYATWLEGTSNNNTNIMLSHDIASVNFDPGANIQITYTWSLS